MEDDDVKTILSSIVCAMKSLPNLRRKALDTELESLKPICTLVEYPGALVFFSELYPLFYYGNGILVREPERGGRAYWERLFDSAVKSQTEHRLFVFESERAAAALRKEFRDAGYQMYRERYMVRESPFPVNLRSSVECISVNDTGAWDALELMHAQADDDDVFSLADTSPAMKRLFRKTRDVSDGIGIRWFLLRDRRSGEYLSSAGIFVYGEMGRLQSVVTAPRFRKKGYANYLLRLIVNEAFRSENVKAVALCCDRGTIAERIYLGMGFRPVAATASCLKLVSR